VDKRWRLAPIGLVTLFLTVTCAATRDPRSPGELKRDAETWTRAGELRVVTGSERIYGCKSLGIVTEHYYEGPPDDPLKRPPSRNWAEKVLRYKTAELGGDAAYLCPTIRKWSGDLNESRVLGEAFRCGETEPLVAAAR
jgi:hypothetical protein